MTYKETTELLFSRLPAFERSGVSGYKPGLETSCRLAELAGNPQRRYPTIHVAGTNGKGSTSSMLAATLASAGYNTGLYTSPHLVDFRERIRVNGEMIPQEYVVRFVDDFFVESPECRALRPTFFELTTIMAFDYFAASLVDVAVIETGLGGRLDTTNIITPTLSVITNVSLDHTDLLGDTVEAIAAEKAGIIKSCVPVVLGPVQQPGVLDLFEQKARKVDAPLIVAPLLEAIEGEQPWQTQNRSTVAAAVNVLRTQGYDISAEAAAEGVANVSRLTGLRGRWTVVSETPLTVYDTGHNPGAWQYLGPAIASHTGSAHVVLGFVGDKDVDTILGMMPRQAAYYFTQPHNHRALSADTLRSMATAHGLVGECYDSVSEAVSAAQKTATDESLIFVGGSNYLIGEWLESTFC